MLIYYYRLALDVITFGPTSHTRISSRTETIFLSQLTTIMRSQDNQEEQISNHLVPFMPQYCRPWKSIHSTSFQSLTVRRPSTSFDKCCISCLRNTPLRQNTLQDGMTVICETFAHGCAVPQHQKLCPNAAC